MKQFYYEPMRRIAQGALVEALLLHQHTDAELSSTVEEITDQLVDLMDQVYVQCLPQIANNLAGRSPGKNLGTQVGTEFHMALYRQAVQWQAQQPPRLDPRVRITPQGAAGPDFILSGHFDNQDVHAAWDLTTYNALSTHYERDVKGIPQYVRKGEPKVSRVFRERAVSMPVREGTYYYDREGNYWSSYIAICY